MVVSKLLVGVMRYLHTYALLSMQPLSTSVHKVQ